MNYTLVGAFVLLLAAALVMAILWLASGGATRTGSATYQAVVQESVAGLNPNAPVKFNGVDVGKVQSIHLDPEDPARVRLLFAIDEGTPIRADTVAVLRSQGLTGFTYVELSGGSAASPPLEAAAGQPWPEIRTKASLGARLENVAGSVLAKLDATADNINAMLSPQNREAVQQALADVASVARTVAERRPQIDAAITHASRTMRNSERASADAVALMERIGRSADALERMGSEFAQSGRAVTRTVDAVGADMTHFTAQTLPQIDQLVDELTALSASLRRFSEQAERDPRSLLFGRQPAAPGPGETAPAAP